MSNELEQAFKLLQDLDRCEHGRHSIDPCFSCPGGQSTGNPHLRPGEPVGYGIDGEPLWVPDRGKGQELTRPAHWRIQPS